MGYLASYVFYSCKILNGVIHSEILALLIRWAEAILSLDKALASDDRDKSRDKALQATRAGYMRDLGWLHWEKHSRLVLNTDFPADYEVL